MIRAIENDSRFLEMCESIQSGQTLITGLTHSAKAMMIARAYLSLKESIYIITPNLYYAEKLSQDLLQYCESQDIYVYGIQNYALELYSTSSPELLAERIRFQDALSNQQKGIYIIPVEGLMKRVTPKKLWQSHYLEIDYQTTIDRDELLKKLINIGYERRNRVTSIGEYAVRGDIIDVFPIYGDPIRIELFGDEIDHIKLIDIDSQRSKDRLESYVIPKATEFVMTDDLREKLRQQMNDKVDELIKAANTKEDQDGWESFKKLIDYQFNQYLNHRFIGKYIGLIDEYNRNILSYIESSQPIILVDEFRRVEESESVTATELNTFTQDLLMQYKSLPNALGVLDTDFKAIVERYNASFLSLFTTNMDTRIEHTSKFSCKPIEGINGQYDILSSMMHKYMQDEYIVQCIVSTDIRMKKVQQMLMDFDLPVYMETIPREATRGIVISKGHPSEGFDLPYMKYALFTDVELFGDTKQKRKNKTTSKLTNAEKIKSYQELKKGDYVVHIHHGVGQYLGIETMYINKMHQDYMKIQYKGTDQLFVPIDQMDLVQKYVANDNVTPKIYKLGGTDWQKTKARVRASIDDIAEQLMKLYEERSRAKGHKFHKDTSEQQTFELDFPYEPTIDQVRSLNEIKHDMEDDKPMDRLLCGDVGYGKTEVAVRAAFKAVMEGKQVAFLVPTTILAQQHYETIIERMNEYPIEVRLMSRFRTTKQINETKKGLKEGIIDIVVGTHKLLGKTIEYKDLGLLIVDEEQRFGVRHKERIKQLKMNVDVLTLTATPIPRTLHMSLLGVRDLSVIETPPENRFPVQTYVIEHNKKFIKEAIQRELSRDGQVFYLYNKVKTIYQKQEELSLLVPEASIAIAHGQMGERELEEVMIAFVNGEYDILLTTTIIETGVDVPNANTLIVEDADRFGLSQLYQLRGRVGRSHRMSYAYLTHAPRKVLTEVAEKRLQAIKEFTDLGSGFKIAMRDLNIRGAGDLLGKEQHGFIDSVGYDLYSEMLQEAVHEKQIEHNLIEEVVEEQEPSNKSFEVEMNLLLDAYIPTDYIIDEHDKIDVYKRLQQIHHHEVDDLIDELIDRFGEYPKSVEYLIDIVEIKSMAKEAFVRTIKQQDKKVYIIISEHGSNVIHGEYLFNGLNEYGRKIQVEYKDGEITLTYHVGQGEWIKELKQIIKHIGQSYDPNE